MNKKRIKYNRVSNGNTQSGNRFLLDKTEYDITYMDKGSGLQKFSERKYGSILTEMCKKGEVDTLIVEELSRLGRNTTDVMVTMDFFRENDVKLEIRNHNLYSHNPNGTENKTFRLIVGILSNLYENECENIRERTKSGRDYFIEKNQRWGRNVGSIEDRETFLKKEKTQNIIKLLKMGKSVRDISGRLGCSGKLVSKVRKYIGKELELV